MAQLIRGECVHSAIHLINRTPLKVLKNKYPFEVLYQQPPDLQSLKAFGCLRFASSLTVGRDKFMPRTHLYIFLGYPSGQTAYKLLNLITHKNHISRDVKFFENLYPLHLIKGIHSSFSTPSYIPLATQSDKFTPISKFTVLPNENSNDSCWRILMLNNLTILPFYQQS